MRDNSSLCDYGYFSHRWCKKSSHSRAQVLYYIAENMELRQLELAQRISTMTGQSADQAEKEVKVAIQRVFHWAAYTDKYGGTVQVRKNMINTTVTSLISAISQLTSSVCSKEFLSSSG